jgi:hypothetical protein
MDIAIAMFLVVICALLAVIADELDSIRKELAAQPERPKGSK